MINKKLQSEWKDEKTSTSSFIDVYVELNPSTLVTKLAHCYLNELHRVAGNAGSRALDEVEEADILKYLVTLHWMRVCHSVGDPSKSYQMYRKLYSKLSVPVLTYQTLLGVGEAIDRDYAIRFIPVVPSIKATDLLAPDELRKLSDLMLSFQQSGFKLVTGLPPESAGELEFMAMSHVDEVVRSYRKSHPVYGFLASFFSQQQLNQVTGSLSRIVYGYETDYEVNVARLVATIGGID